MTVPLLDRVVVPLATPGDAARTAAAVGSYLDAGTTAVTVVHVVEKAGGAPDKASVEQREAHAREAFAVVEEALADRDYRLDTRLAYGTDVADAILDVAEEVDATAIAFTPRDGARWAKLLAGDVARDLRRRADRPVVVVPHREGEG